MATAYGSLHQSTTLYLVNMDSSQFHATLARESVSTSLPASRLLIGSRKTFSSTDIGKPRVERIAQAIAEQIESQHREHDSKTRNKD